MFGSKPLRIRFEEVDGFVRIYSGIRYLVIYGPEKYDATYNRIIYLISQKCGITKVFSPNYGKINIDSYDSLLLQKTLTLRNFIILIKLVFNEDKNNFCYTIFSQKCLYK